MGPCPHCGEDVAPEETVCWNCGGNLTVGDTTGPTDRSADGRNQTRPPGRSDRSQSRGGPGNRSDRQQDEQGQHDRRQDEQSQHAHERQRDSQRQYDRERRQADRQRRRSQQGDQQRPRSQQQQGRQQLREQFERRRGQHQPRQSADSGRSRRQLLAGSGIVVAAAAGGWYVFLREETPTAPDSPGTSFGDAPETPTGRHGPYEVTSGEEHFFAVELDPSERLSARIYFSHDAGDLDLAVYDPTEQRVDRSVSTNDGEAVSVTADAGGTHYIKPYAFGDATNEYELSVRID